jgi:hypothetical protein
MAHAADELTPDWMFFVSSLVLFLVLVSHHANLAPGGKVLPPIIAYRKTITYKSYFPKSASYRINPRINQHAIEIVLCR